MIHHEQENYTQALECSEREKWLTIMHEEIDSLHKNKTWVLVQIPKGKKLVDCKWIFKKKEEISGIEKARYKAKLVARGFT